MKSPKTLLTVVCAGTAGLLLSIGGTGSVNAATANDLNQDANRALRTLYNTNPLAQQISTKARAILIFPNIVKAGLVFGGSYGEGVLEQDRRSLIITIPYLAPGDFRPAPNPMAMRCS
jgi:lipid-binding SYLF domain-containing protein